MKTSLWNAVALAHLSLIIGFHPLQGSMNHPELFPFDDSEILTGSRSDRRGAHPFRFNPDLFPFIPPFPPFSLKGLTPLKRKEERGEKRQRAREVNRSRFAPHLPEFLFESPNSIALGYSYCTDHSTVRTPIRLPNREVFIEIGEHADLRPFQCGPSYAYTRDRPFKKDPILLGPLSRIDPFRRLPR